MLAYLSSLKNVLFVRFISKKTLNSGKMIIFADKKDKK